MSASFLKSSDPEEESFGGWFFSDGWGATAVGFGAVGAVLFLGYWGIAVAVGTRFLLAGMAMAIVGTVLLGVGVVIAASRRRERVHYLRVMRLGTAADATVDRAGVHARGVDERSVGNYHCTYSFPCDGGSVTVDESVTRAMSRELEAGVNVRIRYLPGDSARARIVRHQMYL